MKNLFAIFLVLVLLVVPAATQAAWADVWLRGNSTITSVKSGQWATLVIGGESITDFSTPILCLSESGCTVRVRGGGNGSYGIYALVDRDDSGTEASYIDTTAQLGSTGTVQFIDLTSGEYAFKADVAGTSAGVIEFSGN